MLQIKQPKTEKEFEAYYDLRWRVLREPWKQPRASEKDELENASFHIMACNEDNKIMGVGRLHFNNKSEAQIRYMAVDSEYLNRGVGKLIIKALEKKARQKQCKTILLEAREPALNFYEKQGYDVIKKSYLLFDGIQHYSMKKLI